MKLMTISSGSSGNSSYVGTDNTTILVDVGNSMKNIVSALEGIGISGKDVDAILITHEHIDHIKGLGILARKYNVPIYATYGTIDGIMTFKSLGTFDYNLFHPIKNDASFEIGDITINTRSISHDANDPTCYNFTDGKSKISIATDFGTYDSFMVDFLSESDAMVIESNHDVRMLEVGPYPFPLKQRILSDKGHISNETSGRLIKQLLNNHLKHISLGHLSDKNNYPDLAYETVKQEISDNIFTDDVRDFGLTVAPRYDAGELIEV